MKQRFSSLDVKVIAHELQQSLVTLRLANVYDLSSKILLFKFAKQGDKKQFVIDSGFRCHLTDFARTTAAAPSPFVARLRKLLKTRRVTGVSQVGTDRIIEFQFSDGQYKLYLEFFASGNVIVTDAELKILALMRNVPEGKGDVPLRVGLQYSLHTRQNYGGAPPFTRERLRNALQSTVDKAAAAAAAGKPLKKQADELRKGLATTITEIPSLLLEHAFKQSGFDKKTKVADVLGNEADFDRLFTALLEARGIVDEITNASACVGYIIAKKKEGEDQFVDSNEDVNDVDPRNLLYDDFHPFLPRQYENDSACKILKFDNFNKTVDEFYSSIEGQRLESKLTEREAAAKKKLDSTKREHAKRIEGLQDAQLLNRRKAAAIEVNVERVQEAMDAISGLLEQGMDWVNAGKLVEREQRYDNPVAKIIKLPLKLAENTITLLLAEEDEEEEDDDQGYETASSISDTEDSGKDKSADRRLEIDINLGLSPWANSREYYDQKRTAAAKEHKTVQQSTIALKNAERKVEQDLKKGLKTEKPILRPIRKQLWFEKFYWFISSDGYLTLGGRDAQQNEMLYKRYLRKGDVYVHADLHGAPSVVIKNNPQAPDAPIPPSTLSQAGNLAVCASNAWDSKAGMGAYWVLADQVSKSAPTGEFLPAGSFMIRGKKNFLLPAQLLLGFGILFRVSEESKLKHMKHRLQDGPQVAVEMSDEREAEDVVAEVEEQIPPEDNEAVDDEAVDDGNVDDDDKRANPLQSGGREAENEADDDSKQELAPALSDLAAELQVVDEFTSLDAETSVQDRTTGSLDASDADEIASDAGASVAASLAPNTATPQNKGPLKRGQRGKAKKMAAKYKDQDEEDRAAVEALIGSAAGRHKAEAEAKAKAEREAELTAQKERRTAQHARQLQATKEHEELRRLMLDEGVEMLEEEQMGLGPLDALVGTPLPRDEILEAIPICAPWTALGKLKYKAKLQPGPAKKGKAVKEILERWKYDANKKGALDEQGRDKEKMWPREVELIKGLKPEDSINCVPAGRVTVLMSGGSGGGGASKGGQGKGGKGGKGGGGGKGPKKR